MSDARDDEHEEVEYEANFDCYLRGNIRYQDEQCTVLLPEHLQPKSPPKESDEDE